VTSNKKKKTYGIKKRPNRANSEATGEKAKKRTGEADQKRIDARRPKFRGTKRTQKYAAVTRNEANAADGLFSSAS